MTAIPWIRDFAIDTVDRTYNFDFRRGAVLSCWPRSWSSLNSAMCSSAVRCIAKELSSPMYAFVVDEQMEDNTKTEG